MRRHKQLKTALNDELRRLQKIMAVLIACQVAAEEGAEFDVADVIAVAIALLRESLAGVDCLEVGDAKR